VLAPTATITVVELMGAVVQWNRVVLGALAGHPLADPRVRVVRGDVRKQLGGDQSCDAVLLDVDNGPGGLTQASNGWLYGPAGLHRLRRTLRPGGAAAIWSAQADPGFTARLGAAGLDATAHTVRARANGKGPRHTIWIGIAPV
jgi:spermidine synthase